MSVRICFYCLVAGAIALAAGCSDPGADRAGMSDTADARPNFLFIVVDDMGFNELGSFGGEIETPNLDALAFDGIRLSQFIVAATCSPTRAMLLTGVDSHSAGLGNMLEELSPNQKGQPGYEGYLNHRVKTVASLLRDSGYATMMTGKWHLGQTKETGPSARGFERSFALLPGGASHFADMRPAYAPTPQHKAKYTEDGALLESLPSDFNYSSQFYVDRLIDYLRDKPQQPFFAYLSFTAPHWPLQAPDAAIDKYAGRYDSGYGVVGKSRLEKARKLGVLPPTAVGSEPPPKAAPWQTLSPARQKAESRAMEIYAAMIDEVDRHSGRLIDYLRSENRLDNTVVIFLSDNGAEGHDLDETWPADLFPDIRRTIDESHDFSFDNMGRPGSYTLLGPNWAHAGSPAFRLHKAFPTEGGVRTAAFVRYPSQFQGGTIVDQPVSVLDIVPTVLELAGVEPAATNDADRPLEAIDGLSVAALLRGEPWPEHRRERELAGELFGKRAVRRGNWKLVHMPAPFGTGDWQLFDLANDLGESRDVSQEHPATRAQLLAVWERYAKDKNVIIPDWVSGY